MLTLVKNLYDIVVFMLLGLYLVIVLVRVLHVCRVELVCRAGSSGVHAVASAQRKPILRVSPVAVRGGVLNPVVFEDGPGLIAARLFRRAGALHVALVRGKDRAGGFLGRGRGFRVVLGVDVVVVRSSGGLGDGPRLGRDAWVGRIIARFVDFSEV